jgi:glycosyltransferase involved in cell wall biosynthesis
MMASSVKRQTDVPTITLPSVSVLLPAWNSANTIDQCLESLLSVDWPDVEIIVCAGGTDGTLERAERYSSGRVYVLEQRPGEGKQRALRRCFEVSRGEVIYLTDSDCVVSNESFHALLQPLVDGHFDVSTGASVPLEKQRSNSLVRYQWGKDLAWGRLIGATTSGIHGRNSAVRRSTLVRVGAFSADVSSGTDYHLSQRLRLAGIPIAWTQSLVQSEYPTEPVAYVRMWRRWIKNVLVQGIQTGSYREVMSTGIGIGTSATLLGLPLLSLVIDRMIIAPWLALLGFISFRRFRAHRYLEQVNEVPPIEKAAVAVPAFVLLDALSAIWGLFVAIHPAKRREW